MDRGLLFHDDTIADFGGNDGFAANEFFKKLAIKPLVVDCEPQRIDHAWKVYGLPTYQAFLEDMKDLADKSIAHGFCSHTLEHTRNPKKALREIARVVKGTAYFVCPIEDLEHAKHNHAHSVRASSIRAWVGLIESCGWRTRWSKRMPHEAHVIAEPT
jgi:ubiquinone/menaquinone biosynthesis C-methylase UbiE